MLDTPNANRVRDAIRRMETHQQAHDQAMEDRDQAIADLFYDDGIKDNDIAREVGMSKSNIVRIRRERRPR